MVSTPRDQDRKQLEHELETDEYQNLLVKLQRKAPFLRRFDTWRDVIAFMRAGTSRDPRKDEVLRPILTAHDADQDYRWRKILLAIFWPALVSIRRRKFYWDEDEPDELWQRIFWAFHQAICRIDLARRPRRLAQKIVNDAIHDLYLDYQRCWDHASREVATDPDELDEFPYEDVAIDLDEMIDAQTALAREISRLRGHLNAGRITEGDFVLIVGTRIYGRSIAEYAREMGLDYELVKKRRQRVEAAIGRFETRS